MGSLLAEGRAVMRQSDHFHGLTAHEASSTVLQVGGELDASAVPALRTAVRTAWAASVDVELDVADVTFLDCAALGALVALDREARDHSCSVRLRNVPDQVRWLVRFFDLDALVLEDPPEFVRPPVRAAE